MIDIADMLSLSTEEKAVIQKFEKDLDRVMNVPLPVLQDSEISKIEEILTKLTQEIIERGRQQTDKINT